MSPTGREAETLLWAHQLQRQHGHLQARMDKLESQHNAYDARIKSAEYAAKAVVATEEKVDAMTKRIRAIEDDDSDIQAQFKERIGVEMVDIQKQLERCRKKCSTMEEHLKSQEADIDKASTDNMSSLQKVARLDAALQTLLEKCNADHIQRLTRRLDEIEIQRSEDARKAHEVATTVTELQKTCQSYTTRNVALVAEITRLEAVDNNTAARPGLSLETTIQEKSKIAQVQVPTIPRPKQTQKSLPRTFTSHPRKSARIQAIVSQPPQDAQVPQTEIRSSRDDSPTPDLDVVSYKLPVNSSEIPRIDTTENRKRKRHDLQQPQKQSNKPNEPRAVPSRSRKAEGQGQRAPDKPRNRLNMQPINNRSGSISGTQMNLRPTRPAQERPEPKKLIVKLPLPQAPATKTATRPAVKDPNAQQPVSTRLRPKQMSANRPPAPTTRRPPKKRPRRQLSQYSTYEEFAAAHPEQ
ncbi:hypothetical protein BDV95DRAFT_95213 [Massariosphaeria phaeospora]|uniref:Uncharacterized protein n=1 Tax=Massariosphaeria phaeospora TaxID=100035 RepID=A0A7C8MH14_9PLEO|nr:hypothetical protein BDV95DRAFT_95213 [Massariosphaeria phaeospora]